MNCLSALGEIPTCQQFLPELQLYLGSCLYRHGKLHFNAWFSGISMRLVSRKLSLLILYSFRETEKIRSLSVSHCFSSTFPNFDFKFFPRLTVLVKMCGSWAFLIKHLLGQELNQMRNINGQTRCTKLLLNFFSSRPENSANICLNTAMTQPTFLFWQET